jgi:hypothetical protein
MAAVKSIGEGYYGIVTDGVAVEDEVASRIDRAFLEAIARPAKKSVVVRKPVLRRAKTTRPKTRRK